jgi:uncharacterized BrkB/YihY/UPF0761 family membrane protein
MFVQAILLTSLFNFWQANSSEVDSSYEMGRTVGFCMGPVLLLLIVFALYKVLKKKPNK